MFEKDGILIKENFLQQEVLKKLNEELDLFYSRYSVSGGLYSTFVSRGKQECTVPAMILSVNIFEIIIDVAEQFENHFEQFSSKDYVLTSLHVFSEKDNPTPLFWHTDNRDGMVRAMIYLRGGSDNSGKFMYMKGTHNRDYYVKHKLSEKEIEKLQDKVLHCTAPEGSLIIFDSLGFHAKKKCLEERRTLFLEFQPRDNQRWKERILLSSNHLTEKVIRKIKLFSNLDFRSEHLGIHGHEVGHQNPRPLPLKILLIELVKFIQHSILHFPRRIYLFLRGKNIFKQRISQ